MGLVKSRFQNYCRESLCKFPGRDRADLEWASWRNRSRRTNPRPIQIRCQTYPASRTNSRRADGRRRWWWKIRIHRYLQVHKPHWPRPTEKWARSSHARPSPIQLRWADVHRPIRNTRWPVPSPRRRRDDRNTWGRCRPPRQAQAWAQSTPPPQRTARTCDWSLWFYESNKVTS